MSERTSGGMRDHRQQVKTHQPSSKGNIKESKDHVHKKSTYAIHSMLQSSYSHAIFGDGASVLTKGKMKGWMKEMHIHNPKRFKAKCKGGRS